MSELSTIALPLVPAARRLPLPPEVFLDIVEEAAYEDPLTLIAFTGVCGSWRECLHRHSPLWSTIDMALHPLLIDLFIAHAKDQLLDIEVDLGHLLSDISDAESYAAQCHAVNRHLDRAQRLCIRDFAEDAIFTRQTLATHLVNLEITGPEGPGYFPSLDIPLEQAPSLRSMTLRLVDLKFTSTVLGVIHHLHLDCCARPELSDLAECMNKWTELRTLTMLHSGPILLGIAEYLRLGYDAFRRVELPNLTSLSVKDFTCFVTALCYCLPVQPSVAIEFEFVCCDESAVHLPGSLLSFFRGDWMVAWLAASCPPQVEFESAGSKTNISLHGGVHPFKSERVMKIVIRDISKRRAAKTRTTQAVVECLLSHLRSLVTLRIRGESDALVDPTFWQAILPYLTGVHTLVVYGCGERSSALAELVARLPRLANLCLRGCHLNSTEHGTLWKGLEERKNLGNRPLGYVFIQECAGREGFAIAAGENPHCTEVRAASFASYVSWGHAEIAVADAQYNQLIASRRAEVSIWNDEVAEEEERRMVEETTF